MKKLVSILLIAVVLVSVMSVTAFASNYTPGEYLYEDVFLENYSDYIGDIASVGGSDYTYSEKYYHHVDENDPDSEIDWVLVRANSMMGNPWFVKQVVKDRVFTISTEGVPFSFGIAILDVESKTFYEISNSTLDRFSDSEEIVFNQFDYGTPIGDADGDGILSVMDATFIQQVAAELCDYSEYDDISWYYDFGGGLEYVSDMNRDGERNILDATAIQFKLAELDNFNNELVYVEYDEIPYPNTYPSKPDDCVQLEFETKGNSNSYNYNLQHLGYPDNFFAIVKTKEQYDYVFNRFRYVFSEDFFETHWLLASMTHTSCDEEVAKISEVNLLGDTLYVTVDEYIPDPDGGLSPSEPPYVSLVAIEKSKLDNVSNIVRVS